jgi:hypothetical protein
MIILALSLSAGLLPALSASAAPFTQENQPENLKALFHQIHENLYTKKDKAAAAALFVGMIPDAGRIKKALKDDVSPETVQKILDMFQRLGIPTAAMMPMIFPQEITEVKVYGATTEEIAAYKDGSTAYNHFSGGARQAARQILRPGMTFYSVKLSAPGGGMTKTFHLFYWDGQQWSMLAKAWQALK